MVRRCFARSRTGYAHQRNDRIFECQKETDWHLTKKSKIVHEMWVAECQPSTFEQSRGVMLFSFAYAAAAF